MNKSKSKEKFKIGEILETGLIPCKKCNERHVEVVIGLNGGYPLTSWAWDSGKGHVYEPKNKDIYIQEQRDFINKLLKENKRLKSKLHKRKK